MASARSSELLHGQRGVARIEQDRVNLRRYGHGLVQGLGAQHVDHLHEPDAGQRLAKLLVGSGGELVDDLQGRGPEPSVLSDDRGRVLEAGEQERRDTRWHNLRHHGNRRFFDHAGAAGHGRHQPQRRGAVAYGRPGFGDIPNAADLDPGLAGRLHDRPII